MIMALNISKEFANLPDGTAVFVISGLKDPQKISIQILKTMLKDRTGLYVTINEPYSSLKSILKRNKIDDSNMFFIDCITQKIAGKSERTDKCLFISSPSNLTELGIAITEALHAIPGRKKFLFLDTLSTLLVYNKPDAIARFSHFSISKIKLMGLAGVFMSVQNEMDAKLQQQISQFSSKVVRIGGDN